MLLLLCCVPAQGAAASSLAGTVADGAGHAVPGATVRVQDAAAKETHEAVTNSDGIYVFPTLAEGTYELRIEHKGFQPYVRPGVVIAPSAALTVDVRLAPGRGADTGAAQTGNPADSGNTPTDAEPPAPRQYNSKLMTTKGGFLHGVSRREALLGDAWGLREQLSKVGMSLDVFETSEALGNLSGGVKRGAAYDGLTQVFLQLDTQRAFHWYGGTFNVSALQIHGNNLSADSLYSLQTASGIESNRATRLWELWYDQKFGETDRFDIKIGQQSLDQEFMVSQNALLFVNTMFGWAMLPSADMPGGGPAYPLSALGVRARARVTNSWTLLAGVFNGRPASDTSGDAQENNSSGTSFPLHGGVLAIGELQYAYPSMGAMVHGNKKSPLPRVYKLGYWYDTTRFDDQRIDNSGLSLANPASTGVPRTHRGDYAFYGVADQMLWLHPDEADRNVNVFVRAMGTPQTDRNLIDFSLNAGLTFNEPIWHRDDDSFGVGMGYAHVSGGAAALDRDFGLLSGTAYPVRSGETFIEVTYRYQLRPWWQWQPTFQYVFTRGLESSIRIRLPERGSRAKRSLACE